ncbi:MAG: M42 family metallopeptidase [Anaerolineae bacterium]|nr:M42 family metallopeptidase [Anaerolineae bacterium]
MITFLVGLLNTPSPTGYHREAIDYVERAFSQIPNLHLKRTTKGALQVTIPGRSSNAPRALTAHVDTLGAMVKEIKPNGRLKLAQVGGYVWNEIELEGVTIRTFDDRRYRGTVVPVNASSHVNSKLGEQPRNADTMEVRLDERTSSADQTRALGIEVGDFVFLDPRVEASASGFVRSRHLDDKAGVAAIYGALLALAQRGLQPAQQCTVLISNYEEVGHGGADSLPNDLAEYVVIDMGALGDGQNGDEFSVSICAKDSSGPYHFDLTGKLRGLATAFNIPYKVDIYPFYGSDGSMYWRSAGRARVGLIGPGIDASHAYERTHVESIIGSAHLIARYLLDG